MAGILLSSQSNFMFKFDVVTSPSANPSCPQVPAMHSVKDSGLLMCSQYLFVILTTFRTACLFPPISIRQMGCDFNKAL